jgi:UPF0755 protein
MTRRQQQWLAAGAFVLAVLVLRVFLFFQHLEQPLALTSAHVLEVSPGSNLTRIVRELQAEGIVGNSNDLLWYARAKGIADQIKAGEYELTAGMSGLALLRKLVSGEVTYHQVRLLEGWTLRQALAALQAHPALVPVLDARDPAALQAAFAAETYPEGRFFPDTYNFTRGTTDLEILRRAQVLMQQVLSAAWAGRAVGLPYATPDEALIMASIVEKETALESEREQIAGVFIRRLQRNMRLQTDPTVIYGLGEEFTGDLTRAHLLLDTPWNTYTRDGLPPTPIALPGRGAIEASLHPDEAENLYFVARGDGSHYFSATLEEHNKAVRQFQLGITQDSQTQP